MRGTKAERVKKAFLMTVVFSLYYVGLKGLLGENTVLFYTTLLASGLVLDVYLMPKLSNPLIRGYGEW